MTTSISGTAFTAVHTTNINKTNKELSQEEIISSSDTKTDKTSNISYETSQKLEDSQLVAFKDPTNDKYVLLSLRNDTIDTLKSHFAKDDFYERDDGILKLDNRAEAYVSGWFGDIAYKRDFLKSDSNNDGKLNEKEYDNTKNSFSHSGEVLTHGSEIENISVQTGDIYESSSNKEKNIINQFNNEVNITIDKQLDLTINKDKDFNSEISFEEALTEYYKKGATASIVQLANDMVGNDIAGLNTHKDRANILDIEFTKELLVEMMKEASRQQDTLQKLKVENGDITTLNKDEIKLLDGLLPEDKKIMSNDEIDKISDNIKNDIKIKETYKKEQNSDIKILELKG